MPNITPESILTVDVEGNVQYAVPAKITVEELQNNVAAIQRRIEDLTGKLELQQKSKQKDMDDDDAHIARTTEALNEANDSLKNAQAVLDAVEQKNPQTFKKASMQSAPAQQQDNVDPAQN